MRLRLIPALAIAIAALATACADTEPVVDDDTVDTAEQDLNGDVTRILNRVQDPDNLTAFGDNVYFTTTYATGRVYYDDAPIFEHDIWVKVGSQRAKRLYKALPGEPRGLFATPHGLYEEHDESGVVRYPFDGSKPRGEVVFQSTFQMQYAENGVSAVGVDDAGMVVTRHTIASSDAPSELVAAAPDGTGQVMLGSIPHRASTVTVTADKAYVGTHDGRVFITSRDGSSPVTQVASVSGRVHRVAIHGGDIYVGTAEGLFLQRVGAASAEKLVTDVVRDVTIVDDLVVFTRESKGVRALPLAGGAVQVIADIDAPGSLLATSDHVFVTSMTKACTRRSWSFWCSYSGSVLRMKRD